MADTSKEAQDRAEASFKKKEQQAREGAKAMTEYEAEGRAVRERTSRLKSLRLANEAAQAKADAEAKTVADAKKLATKKPVVKKAVTEKSAAVKKKAAPRK